MQVKKRIAVPILSVVTLTFNNQKHIKKCLYSLKKSIEYSKLNAEVTVVDNDSTDKTSQILKKIKFINLHMQDNNSGFSKGINLGIRKSKGKLILILNPDTIIKKDSIINLINCHLESKSGITGGKTIKKDGSAHGSYVREPNIFTLLFDYTNMRKLILGDMFHKRHYYHELIPKETTSVDAVSGSYMLIDKKVISKIGYFDEKFFMYLEDVDFCLRAKKHGYRISYCSDSIITHIGGASSNNKDKINYSAWNSSRSYYTRKNFGLLTNAVIQPIFFIDEMISKIWRKIR